jgi:hypothetical protein
MTPPETGPANPDGRRPAVLHVVPGHVAARPGQGSHKDVAGRTAFIRHSGARYRYCTVNGDDPAQLDETLSEFAPTHVLIEYSYFPRIAKSIRRRFPDARLAVRAHNIEPLQHWTLAGPGERDLLLPLLRCAYVTGRLFLADLQMARLVDHIFLIAPGEAKSYWRWLGAARKTSWLPYMAPPDMHASNTASERQVIACLPGGTESRRTRDLVNGFASFARAAKESGWNESFVVTGDLTGWQIQLNPAVQAAGFIDDLPAFYGSVAAVAVLSPLGYGFKTTIGDAVACGAQVLADPKIWATLPDELKPHAAAVTSLQPAALVALRSRLRALPDSRYAIAALRKRFEAEMNSFLLNASHA